jgi:hypothetical protein
MDHLDLVTAFLNPEIDDDDIYMTLPEGWAEGSNAPKIVVRLRKALYGLKQAPQLWHDDINAFPLSLGFTQSSADPNLYLRSDGILILLQYRRYLHVITRGCYQSRDRSQSETLREIQDHEPRPGTPISRHRDLPQ